jgi:predicted GIY-YIG superfamily endonuclease
MPYVYILKCANNSYYTGSTVDLAHRLAQHQAGTYGGYASKRLPVTLVWSQEVQTDNEAFLLERKLKGWSRAKEEALIRGDFGGLHEIVRGEWVREWKAKACEGDGSSSSS